MDTQPYIPNMPETCEQRCAREHGIDSAPDPLAYTDSISYATAKREWIYAVAKCEWAESLKGARVRHHRRAPEVLGTVKSVRHLSILQSYRQSYALVEWDDGLTAEHPAVLLRRVHTAGASKGGDQ